VRQGAVRTLTGALLAHGTHLDAPAWRGCVRRTLLPLLTLVMLGDAAVGAEAAVLVLLLVPPAMAPMGAAVAPPAASQRMTTAAAPTLT